MSVVVDAICQSCRNQFKDYDNGLFITCPSCRIPAKKKKHEGCVRWKCKGGSDGRSKEQKENIYETKYGG